MGNRGAKSRFRFYFEKFREKYPKLDRKFLRNMVRKELANSNLNGLSYVSEMIKKEYGVILPRRERRQRRFKPIYSN